MPAPHSTVSAMTPFSMKIVRSVLIVLKQESESGLAHALVSADWPSAIPRSAHLHRHLSDRAPRLDRAMRCWQLLECPHATDVNVQQACVDEPPDRGENLRLARRLLVVGDAGSHELVVNGDAL